MGSVNNAACLMLYRDRDTCNAEECTRCTLLKNCKEKGINLNKDDQKN